MIMNPVLFPLWLGGLVWLLFGKSKSLEDDLERGRQHYRLLGWTYLVVLTAFIALKAKNYYVAPVYPILFAAGAIGLERMAQGRRIGTWVRSIYVALVIVIGALLMPFSVPVLSPAGYLRYQKTLGFQPSEFEHQQNGPLPQWFADEFGWQEMVEKVARVLQQPAAGRARPHSHLFQWLGRCGRGGLLRTPIWPAPGHQQA
jgi:hypothetical protein